MSFTRSQSKIKIDVNVSEVEVYSNNNSKKLKVEESAVLQTTEDYLSKNSFNRFGDDLTEVLLSYLSIVDKFRFECISKQWQRLIFNRQYRVVLDFYEILDNNTIKTPKNKEKYNLLFAHLFRKLKLLRDIRCNHFFNTTTIESIISECRFVERIAFNGQMKIDLFYRLFEKFGQRLVAIDLSNIFIKKFDNIFRFTPNLMELKLNRHLNHLVECFLPKLVDITFPLNVSSELLSEFTDKYFNQIRKMYIRFDQNSTSDQMNRCLTLVSRYANLESLTLKLRITSKSWTALDAGLKLIGNKCRKLQHFLLKSSHYITNDNLLSVINQFQSLITLKLFIQSSNYQSLGTVAELNSSKLKHLTLEFNGMTDQTFADIHVFLPNLKSFQSKDFTNNNLTDQTLNSFSKLQTLRSLSMIGKHFTESGALTVIQCCPQINYLDINYDTTLTTVKAMSALAVSHPKTAYTLCVNLWPNKSRLRTDRKKIPINLQIIQY